MNINSHEEINSIKKITEDKEIITIDPEQEHKDLLEMLGGKVVKIEPSSGSFNPFELDDL